MPALAQTRLAALNRWIVRSSRPRYSPFGKAIARGAYASVVSQLMNAPLAGAFEPDALPIAVSADLAGGLALPPIQLTNPLDQGSMSDRFAHFMFLAMDGRELPPAIWIALAAPDQTLQEAQDDAGVGNGLADLPRFFMPLYRLPPAPLRDMRGLFPYISTHPDPPRDEIGQFDGRPVNDDGMVVRATWGW